MNQAASFSEHVEYSNLPRLLATPSPLPPKSKHERPILEKNTIFSGMNNKKNVRPKYKEGLSLSKFLENCYTVIKANIFYMIIALG